MKRIVAIIMLLSMIGLADSAYLSYEHFANVIPPCTEGTFADCGKVLQSNYALLFGVPVAVLGMLHYGGLLFFSTLFYKTQNILFLHIVMLMTAIGAGMSIYFVYLQIGVIGSICVYCMVSAVNSWLLFPLSIYTHKKYGKEISK